MKACISVLIAASEPFPGHADNTSYSNNHIWAVVEYLLNWDSSYKEKENEAPTTAEDGKFSSTLISLYLSRWETRNRSQLDWNY